MEIVFHFVLGFVISLLGFLFPSMLSMTIIKISLKENRKTAVSFAFGASFIILGQSYLAIAFSKKLMSNPAYLFTLQQIGSFVFLGLSIYFFYKAAQSKKSQPKERKIKGFSLGLLLSFLNMFAIPFYFGSTSSLAMAGWYEFNPINNFCFVIGSSLGVLVLLLIYASLAKKLETKMLKLANQMDFILGCVLALIAIFSFIDILS
ncbi:LysE family transporter [Pseudotenacibaculum sp. MALMAid0570]|uniref:LysE family transporter n=1 Tax=Pseudotenacibaculum sp. MALMAid0570 TaxID=3143938 RepID=UPI0032DF91B3